MGVTIIASGCDFSASNIGHVTRSDARPVALASLAITGSDTVIDSGVYGVSYTPADTTQRNIRWSVETGGQFASIDQSGKVTALKGASSSQVTIKAQSTDNTAISATKDISVTKSAEVLIGTLTINQGDASGKVSVAADSAIDQIVAEIRASAKRYAGISQGNGIMSICEIDDSSTRLKGSETAIPDNADVWVKLPEIWYKGENSGDNSACQIRLSLEEVDGFHKFDGNTKLIAAYNTGFSNGKFRSVPSLPQAKNLVRETIDTVIAGANGIGFSGMRMDWHNIIRILFLAAYKDVDAESIIGCGSGYGVIDNYHDDSSHGDGICNFLGIQDIMQGIYVTNAKNDGSGNILQVTDDNGSTRSVPYPTHPESVSMSNEAVRIITKMRLGSWCDFVPLELGGVVTVSASLTVKTGWTDVADTYKETYAPYMDAGWALQGSWEADTGRDAYGMFSSVCNINSASMTGKTRMCFFGTLIEVDAGTFVNLS